MLLEIVCSKKEISVSPKQNDRIIKGSSLPWSTQGEPPGFQGGRLKSDFQTIEAF